jgi:hypothetical protein
METIFATHNGCVANTACVTTGLQPPAHAPAEVPASSEPVASGLGGQIGELTAALNTIGWNHHQVPQDERVTAQEAAAMASAGSKTTGLGGQIGELTAALNTVGWNHHQVPQDERLPKQERS